jgi:Flp pilus assembly protein TadG
MRIFPQPRRCRHGAITPLVAILLVFLLACVAFSVDLGYIALVHAQLQNAADSAALAGASQLLDASLLEGTPGQSTATSNAMANARSQAQAFAHDNYGGGLALTLDANNSDSSSGDIVIGYIANPSDRTQVIVPTVAGSPNYPNCVQVRVHRDSIRNGSLSLFFARALGIDAWDLQAKATACYQGGIVGFKYQSPGLGNCKLLPFAMQIDTWNQLLAGSGPDNFTRVAPSSSNPAPNNVSPGADGIHEGTLFPLSNNLSSGNFGMVDLGPPANGTPVYENWILNGPSTSDLGYFNSTNGYPNGFALDPTTGTLLLHGTPGVHAAMQTDLQDIIGQARIIPLYSTVTGNGNNAQYTIVGFAGCSVVDVNLRGSLSSKHITIQPCYAIDSTAVSGSSTSFTNQYIVQPLGLLR